MTRNVFDAEAHHASIRLQVAVIHILRAAGIACTLECPGYIWLSTHKRYFIHWYGRRRWQDETDALLGERNHLDAKEVAAAIAAKL
jgi:hypothetical protein